jgi:putative peptidoglycan lipid II flippase
LAQNSPSAPEHRPPHAVARATAGLAALTILSMATGLGVEMLLAWAFGASAVVDAYRVDYLLISLGTQLFVLQIMPNVTVPVFTEYRERGEHEYAWRAAMSFGNLMTLVAIAAAVACFAWPGGVVALLAPGLRGPGLAAALVFARWFPAAVALMAWSGAAVGILYANGVFWPPMTASAVGNVLFAASIALWGGQSAAASIAIGVFLGAASTLILTASALLRFIGTTGYPRIRVLLAADFRHPGVKKSFRLAMPMLGTLAIGFWGSAVMYRALSTLPAGAISVYGYAWKLVQLSTLLPGALLTVSFPRLSASWCESPAAFRATCTKTLRMALFVSIILCSIAFAFRTPIVSLLLQHGALSRPAAAATAGALAFMLLGGPGYVVGVYAQRMFYAAQDSALPTVMLLAYVSLLTVFAPIVVPLYGIDGASGLLGICQLLGGAFMLVALGVRHRAVRLGELGRHALTILTIAAAAAWLGAEVGARAGGLAGVSEISGIVAIAVGSCVALTLFAGATLLLGMQETLLGQQFLRSEGSAILRRFHHAGIG